MLRKLYTLSLIILIAFAACNKEDDKLHNQEGMAVSFNSSIFEGAQTRVIGANWENGDKIGVFAIESGSTLQEGTIVENYDNFSFSTTGNGVFTHDGQPIYFPEDGSAIDFISYYPYSADITAYNYPVDVTQQVDLMYSNNLKNATSDNTTNTLEFNRALSKLIINVVPKGNGSLNGLTVEINGIKTEATFSLADGVLNIDDTSTGKLIITPSGTETKKVVNAILLPTTEGNSIEVVFKANDVDVYKWTVPHALEQGNRYSYNIRLGDLSSEVTPATNYMEIPHYTAGDSAPHSFKAVHMVGSTSWLNGYTGPQDQPIRNYTVMYDTLHSVPYWIAFPLHPIYMDSGNRTNEWTFDPIIPQRYQPNVVNSGWVSGPYDRGHMLASADRSATRDINRTTFYVSNIVPQNSNMNSGTWSDLENKTRNWALDAKYDTLYVVTGSILYPEDQFKITTDIDGKEIAVPEYMYKALLKQDKTTKEWHSIAFNMENIASGPSYKEYVLSVAELEELTGFTFFPNLADGEVVKKQKSLEHWK